MGRVTITLDGDDSRLIRALNKAIRTEKELGAAGRKAGEETAKGAREAKGAIEGMGGSADKGLASIGKLVGGFAPMALAIAGIRAAWEGVIDGFNRGQQALEDNITAINRLAALTGAAGPEARRAVVGLPGLFDLRTKTAIATLAQNQGIEGDELTSLLRNAEAARIEGENPLQIAEAIVGLKGGALGNFSIGQITSFLQQSAKRSPLDMSTFAPVFGRIAGVAGTSAEEQASAAAVLSAQTQALGGGKNAALRSAQGLTSFLAQRDFGKGEIFLKKLGLEGQLVGEQVLGLSSALEGGQISASDLTETFGLNVGPNLTALLRSPGALGGIRDVTGAGVEALEAGGASSLRISAAERLRGDPALRKLNEIRKLRMKREESDLLRGESQVGLTLVREQIRQAAEDSSGGTGSEALGFLLALANPGGANQLGGNLASGLVESEEQRRQAEEDTRGLLMSANEQRDRLINDRPVSRESYGVDADR